jgi:hypothetical protein
MTLWVTSARLNFSSCASGQRGAQDYESYRSVAVQTGQLTSSPGADIFLVLASPSHAGGPPDLSAPKSDRQQGMAGNITLIQCEEDLPILRNYSTFDSRKTVTRDLKLAFSVLYRASSLKML